MCRGVKEKRMKSINLSGSWNLKCKDKDIDISAVVPGSVYKALIDENIIEDPFYRDNEKEAYKYSEYDFIYKRSFVIDQELLAQEVVVLKCDGLDTLAEIKVNNKLIAETTNMHRTYEFHVKDVLVEGENEIEIIFSSPLKYIREKQKEARLWGVGDAVDGYSHIRKAHYMFGWDWGPQLPDMGIWREISIYSYSTAKFSDIYMTQIHHENKVTIDAKVAYEILKEDENLNIVVEVKEPNGTHKNYKKVVANSDESILIDIENPELWWPRGYGEQPLYEIEFSLFSGQTLLDKKDYKIGLRTITIKQEKDQYGESFEFNINGISIFAMGANYIPEDNILGRCDKEKTRKLIEDCIEANFNCIRVWGGGIYPEDYFFDLCDEYGLIVWQDLMYACSVYKVDDEFKEDCVKEAEDNVRRIRHHASLGLWCGNNEIESAWIDWGWNPKSKFKTDYVKLFEIALPEVVKKVDPNTFYWRSSPSSGGSFDDPSDDNRGDKHYWDVWHGLKPFEDFRKFYFRFASEFGFQSFPCLKTVETFTKEEDRNIFSYVMESHQKNGAANGKILYYLAQNYKYPKDFDALLYVSQLLQGEAMKYAVEHFRRNRGRCMGAIYWQLNDCWPVASWSSIDSLGTWKALHYFAKRFFNPVLASVEDTAESYKVYVTNDTLEKVQGTVDLTLRNNVKGVLLEKSIDVVLEPLSAQMITEIDITEFIKDNLDARNTYLHYTFKNNCKIISEGVILGEKAKHFELADPKVEAKVIDDKDKFIVKLKAENLAKYVELSIADQGRFEDNYFDLAPGVEKEVIISKNTLRKDFTLEELEEQLKIRSLVNSY
nr:beta-mannosidase [Clostridium cellulovorans]